MGSSVHFYEIWSNHLPCNIWGLHSVLKKIHVYWNVTPCRLPDHEDGAATILSTSVTVHKSTRYNVPADLDLCQCICQNINLAIMITFTSHLFAGILLSILDNVPLLCCLRIRYRGLIYPALTLSKPDTFPVPMLSWLVHAGQNLLLYRCFEVSLFWSGMFMTAPLRTTVLSSVWRYSSTNT